MHRSEAVNCSSRQGIHRRLVADIGRHGECLGAQARDLLLGGLQRRLLDVGQNHIEPGMGEALGQRQADTASGPGNDGNLPGG